MTGRIVMTRRVMWNKRTGQPSITLPKKQMPGFLQRKKKLKFEIRW